MSKLTVPERLRESANQYGATTELGQLLIAAAFQIDTANCEIERLHHAPAAPIRLSPTRGVASTAWRELVIAMDAKGINPDGSYTFEEEIHGKVTTWTDVRPQIEGDVAIFRMRLPD